MKHKIQWLLWALIGGIWLMAGCANPPAQSLPLSPIVPTPTHKTLLPKPRFCTPISDQDKQLATLNQEWPVPMWLPERVKLCQIDHRWEDLGERLVLSFEGEGRFYNSVAVSITRYPPPRQRGETDLKRLRVNELEIRESFSHGHTILTWRVNGFWIQLIYLGDALDEEEAIRIVEGIILPP